MSTLVAPGAPRDAKGWLVTPALGFIVALFIYPFAYGVVLSFQPMNGGALANYAQFFTDTAMWPTVIVTLKLAVPATLINVGVSLPVAFALRRHSPYQRLVTTLLVIPVTLGTVLVADGMLTYFGPNGWFPQALQGLHLYTDEVRLTHNYWGVLLSLIVSGFPFAFLLMIATVAVNSVATRWFGTPLPQGFTLHWYAKAWEDFQLASVLWVTVEVVGAVVLLSIALGVPAAYALARAQFPGKRFALLVFLLPLMVPPVTYGIPMATVMYKVGLAGTLSGVILANLVPALPFVILVMTPFIEQIDPNLEAAARIFGANTRRYFRYVLLPLLVPGMLAAGLLVLVRTIGMFELTFFTAGPSTQTLVVALYYAVFSTGVRAPQSIDAMAMIYMVITLAWVVIALQFVSPTQLVSRVKQERP